MTVTFSGGTFSGGEKLRAKLQEIADKASGGLKLNVGFLAGATESDGTSTALVAACNEFGATIPARQVDAHTTEIYRKICKRDGSFLRGGRFVKRAQSNFAQEVTIPAHTIPEHKVPPRPFFRHMINLGEDHWAADLGKIMISVNYDMRLALDQLGNQMVGELTQSITDQIYLPLAPSTVKAKGFDTTLYDTASMVRSVDFSTEEPG